MLIGELSKKSGLSRDTIRFYEKQGLISVDKHSRRDNNYKEYPEEVLQRLLLIKRIKRFGFSLDETADILLMIDRRSASCDNISGRVTEKVALLDQKIKELEVLKRSMLSQVESCLTGCTGARRDNCPALVAP